MSQNFVALPSVAQINPRLERSNISLDELVSFIPMAAVSEETQTIMAEENRLLEEVVKGYTYFESGDVLLAKITPCFENGKLALADINCKLGFGSTEFHVLRPDNKILDARYLYHFIRQPSIRSLGEKKMTGSAGQRRIPKSFLESLELFLPPLEQQKRIAAILDKADELRVKRRRAIAKLDELLKSVFLELFTTDESNNWKTVSVESLVAEGKNKIRTGPFGSQLLHSEFTEDTSGVLVLGIDNAVKNRFEWGEPRFITYEKYQELKRYTVYSDDVLITIMGTCGRVAIVPDNIPLAINTKHLCCITLNKKRCLPTYLKNSFLMHPTVVRQLSSSTRGAIMAGLNMGIIKDLKIPLAPLDVQEKFLHFEQQIEMQKLYLTTSLDKYNYLFSSLQARAFSGDLTPDALNEVEAVAACS